jgi:FixJ family two-component response regulator
MTPYMTPSAGPVAIIEDDESVRNGLRRLLRSAGRSVVTYDSAEEFLAHDPLDKPCCLVIDIHLTGMSGVDLVERLAHNKVTIPMVFITATDESASGSECGQGGPVTCLRKPFDEATLMQAIDEAIAE